MRGITNDRLKVGDFAFFAGMRVKDMLRGDWLKVIEVDDRIVKLIDRNGGTVRVRRNDRYQHCHAMLREPGDPKQR